MRYFLTCLVTLFLLSSVILNAQTDVSIHRKDFKTGKSGFEEAWKHVVNGDNYYKQKGVWFNDAFNEYLQALVYNSASPELNYKTGVSALFSDKKEEAAAFFLKAIELKKEIAGDILCLTGRALQYSGRYSEAIEKLTAYLSSSEKKSKKNIQLARKCIDECNSALLVSKDTMRLSIVDAGPNINSSADDYSEVFTADGKVIYFASRRELPQSGKRHSDTKFDENIFTSHLSLGSWEPSTLAGKELATKYSEAPLYINATNDFLYVYEGSANNGDVKVSVNKKGIWKAPASVPYPVNSRGSETSFTFSPDGKMICFVSDNGQNNIGGKDIYFIRKINDRKWSKPQNAGTIINTIYDEEGVRFSRTGDTLWFSSKGHNTIGGFDIFYSVKNKDGAWDSVKNIGAPVSTPWDEVFFYPSSVDDSSFYFVSNRSGGFGGLDIYHAQILPKPVIIPPAPPKPDTIIVRDTIVIVKEAPAPALEPVLLIGKVKDSENGAPVLAKIDISDISGTQIIGTTASSDIDGSYRVKLPAKKSYFIELHATGYLSDRKRIDVPDNWTKEDYNLNIELIKVKVGKKVVLKNILFETGKSVQQPVHMLNWIIC